jgi:transposase InsO family protein
MIYLAHIRIAFKLSNVLNGSSRMHRDLVDEGNQIARRRAARLTRENNLLARQKRRFKRATDGEYAWPVVWQTRRQAEMAVARYFDEFYNPIRRHSTLGYKSPAQFEIAGRKLS